MSEKKINLLEWLQRLAAAFDHVPSEATFLEYEDSLQDWRLLPEQWRELLKRAKGIRLYGRRWPMIAELDEIRQELCREAEHRANAEQVRRLHEEFRSREPESHPCMCGREVAPGQHCVCRALGRLEATVQ